MARPVRQRRGQAGLCQGAPHTHANYFSAFVAAGLRVRGCLEPTLGLDQVQAKWRAFEHVPDATVAAFFGLPGVLVWDVEA